MTRNTKEVALIQIRSGKLSEMPRALHQSEFGLAKDANRLFIGNAANPVLKNREIFPYQNLELLTEYSELKDYFKYSYENNITSANGETDRLKLKEFLPIVVSCHTTPTTVPAGILKINGIDISIDAGSDIYDIVNKINSYSAGTNVYATVFPGSTQVITFVCTSNNLDLTGSNPELITAIGYEPETYDISMPIRKVTEKLDDNLHISDFAIKGDGSNVSKKIFDALSEVYKNYPDNQFYRDVFFPAGNYNYDLVNIDANLSYFTPFPLISNLHVHGEGVDRTILNNVTTNTLLTCFDNNFNSEYGNFDYGLASTPSNILIEDMTFSGDSLELARLIGCSNVTFNRVKFSGTGNNTLITIAGIESSFANNIVFNECIFETAKTAIDIQEYAENVTINNCQFNNIKTPTIKIGNNDETNNVRAITVSGCHFENTDAESGEVISLGTNSKYTSVTNCTFDTNIIEKSGNIVPYKDNGVGEEYNKSINYPANSRCIYEHKFYKASAETSGEFDASKWVEYQRYNYTDILDITTDDKKLLRFKFTQPRWEYINYLINGSGEVVLTVDGKDSDITASNGLNIVENQNGIDIRSVKDGSVTLSMNKDADLELGKPTEDISWSAGTQYQVNDEVQYGGITYKCIFPHTSSNNFKDDIDKWQVVSITQIIIDKVLQLNDNMITNRGGNENIIIEPATDKVIEIQQTDETTNNYENKIVDKPNAIPNVAFVKNYSTSSLIKHITFDDMENVDQNGNLLIGEFPVNQYGENIHITKVTVNIRSPFYKVIPYLNSSSVEYLSNYFYYKGDVVRSTTGTTTEYAVILKTHYSTSSSVVNNDNMKIIPSSYVNDIKYIDVIGNSNGNDYTLTSSCSYNYITNDVEFNKIDIQKNNMFGYNCNNLFNPSSIYNVNDIVCFQDRNYVVKDTLFDSVLDLHDNTLFKRQYDEGFVYTYDEDKNSNLEAIKYNIDVSEINHPYSVNYAGGKVYINLYDSDKTLVTSSNVSTKLLNPAGDMIVKIDFVKEEL